MKYLFGINSRFLLTAVLFPTLLLFSQNRSLGVFEEDYE